MARRPLQPEPQPVRQFDGSDRSPWESRLELMIAILLGLAAIVIAGAVYLNEKQEHKAEIGFHNATHLLIESNGFGPRTPRGAALGAEAENRFDSAEHDQQKAARYTLIEVILASALFLFGVAGVTRRQSVELGAFAAGSLIFLTALVLLATI